VFLTTGGSTEVRVGVLTPLTLEESVTQRALFGGEEVVEFSHVPPLNLFHLAKDLHKAQKAGEAVSDTLLHLLHARTLLPGLASAATASATPTLSSSPSPTACWACPPPPPLPAQSQWGMRAPPPPLHRQGLIHSLAVVMPTPGAAQGSCSIGQGAQGDA
jgi:hypothetical protein